MLFFERNFIFYCFFPDCIVLLQVNPKGYWVRGRKKTRNSSDILYVGIRGTVRRGCAIYCTPRFISSGSHWLYNRIFIYPKTSGVIS